MGTATTHLGGLVLPALEWGEVFHMGIKVADLRVQQELTESLGVSWDEAGHHPD